MLLGVIFVLLGSVLAIASTVELGRWGRSRTWLRRLRLGWA